MQALRRETDNFELPLTPLIDVIFLLLIFFLVATNFTTKEYDQQVKLPRTGSGNASKQSNDNLVINLHKDGTIVSGGRVINWQELNTKLTSWRQQSQGKRVLIRSDGEVAYSQVMEIMGLCRELGIEQVDLPVLKKR